MNGGETMGCCETTSCSTPRNFLTKEEKMEMLGEYKEGLDKEVKAVQERIDAMKKE
jgi:hypothetical protein